MNYERQNAEKIGDEVWEEYNKLRNIEIRDRILNAYLYIVTCNIKRLQSPYINDEIEDLTNQGVIALLDCIEKYDYKRGVQFDSYASIRVRGSIIDYIREKDWVPVSVRRRTKAYQKVFQDYQSEHSRLPTDEEIADNMGVSRKDITKIRRELESCNIIFYEELLCEGDMGIKGCEEDEVYPSPEQKFITDEFKDALVMSIDDLDDKERTVVSLYYYNELKFKDISYVMGLSESRVSQIHTKALMKLKLKMNTYLCG